MARYKEMEKRVDELEALFDAEIVNLGKSNLLAEHEELCKKLNRHYRIHGIISYLVYSFLYFLIGFVYAVKSLP